MDEFVPNRGGPRYDMREEAPPDNGPDNHPKTWAQQLDGFSDEDPDYGPSDDEDKDPEWRHSKRDRPVTLEDADKKCTLTAQGDGVMAKQWPGLAVNGFFAVYSARETFWARVSAFVSTYVSSGERMNENDKWVVKVVHIEDKQKPHVKTISPVFETRYSDSYDMRESLKTWVLERGFDFLLEDV